MTIHIVYSLPSLVGIQKLIGSLELIRGIDKYCIWIENDELNNALNINEIKHRINATKQVRLNSKRKATQKLANEPYKFGEVRYKKTNSIIIPSVSSEKRHYVPMSFLDKSYVIVAPNFAIYNAEPHHLGIITSRMHMTWMRTVAGRLKTDYRYSSTLVYNTFPFPPISTQRKNEITQSTFRILEKKENNDCWNEKILFDDRYKMSIFTLVMC